MMTSQSKSSLAKPWYKEFWAWFILTPLIVVVIVSSIFVTLAVRYGDDRVLDNYYKEGRMINMRLDEDLLAQELQLSAHLFFDQELSELVVRLYPETMDMPESLSIYLGHPVEADFDQNLRLRRVAVNQFHTELPPKIFKDRWYLRIKPLEVESEVSDKQSWRLRSEINFTNPYQSEFIVNVDG